MHPAAVAQIDVPEVIAAVLTFLGGLFLTVDAFSPVRTLYVKRGEEKWQWLVSQLPKDATHAAPSNVVQDNEAFEHAKKSQKLVRRGLLLITAGFLIDLLSKLHVFGA